MRMEGVGRDQIYITAVSATE